MKPGRDIALFNGILHLMIENDWLDHDFIENHTVGFEDVAAQVKQWTPKQTAEVTGIAERAIHQAAEIWGQAKTSFLMHARGIEHHTHGVMNVLGAIDMVLVSGRIGRKNCGYATITGQATGKADANTARNAINFQADAIWEIPNIASTSPKSGTWMWRICRSPAWMRTRSFAKLTRVKSKGF